MVYKFILCDKIYKRKREYTIEELDKLISFIQNEYIEFNKKWQESDYYLRINLKDNLVSDLLENKLLIAFLIIENLLIKIIYNL